MKALQIIATSAATLCLLGLATAQLSPKPTHKPYTPPDPWKGIPRGSWPKHQPEGISKIGGRIRGDKPGNYSHWTAEAWTGSDEPFLAIRKSIDDQTKAGKKPKSYALAGSRL